MTRFFEGVVDPAEAVAPHQPEADVIWVDGHSDYGHALTEFQRALGRPGHLPLERAGARRRPQQLPRARGRGCVEDLQARARHVYWLNPEPRDYWDSGDSIVGEYAAHCDEVVECRTLRQLEHFVGKLA